MTTVPVQFVTPDAYVEFNLHQGEAYHTWILRSEIDRRFWSVHHTVSCPYGWRQLWELRCVVNDFGELVPVA